MIVRVFFVVELILGVLLAGVRLQYLPVNIGLGFLVAICVALLAIMACVKRMFGIGIVGLFFAILLPITGFKQFPLKFGAQIGLIWYPGLYTTDACCGTTRINAMISDSARSGLPGMPRWFRCSLDSISVRPREFSR